MWIGQNVVEDSAKPFSQTSEITTYMRVIDGANGYNYSSPVDGLGTNRGSMVVSLLSPPPVHPPLRRPGSFALCGSGPSFGGTAEAISKDCLYLQVESVGRSRSVQEDVCRACGQGQTCVCVAVST